MTLRKDTLIWVAIIGLIIVFGLPAVSLALDQPHNADESMDCSDCHYMSGASAPSWLTPTGDPDDSVNNRICLQCHDGGMPSVPAALPHSAYRTGSTYWSGTWMTDCTDCHNPHQQRQSLRWSTESYLVTGTVASIGAYDSGTNTTPVTLSAAISGEYQGYYLIPNTKYRTFLYRIESSTNGQATISVKGNINTAYANPAGGYQYAIVFAKNVKDYVRYINPGGSAVGGAVKLFRPSGTNGPADDTNLSTSVCYVCHTQTDNYSSKTGANNSHQGGQDCESCHNHDVGFKKGGCTDCHGSPPVDTATLIFKDKSGAPVTSDSPGAGAHAAHTSAGFDCDNCHTGGMLSGASAGDDFVTIGFNLLGTDLSGSYDGKSGRSVFPYNAGTASTTVTAGNTLQCSNLYCHSTGQGPTANDPTPAYASPKWDTPSSGACGTCHSNTDPGTGSHTAHLSSTVAIQCGDCHTGASDGTTTPTGHINKLIDVANSYNAGGAPGNGYGECSTQACHGGDGSAPNSPTWGTDFSGLSDQCTRCHGTDGTNAAPPKDLMGDTATNDPQVGAHQAHLQGPDSITDPIACTECHIVPTDVADAGHIQDATPGTAEIDFTNAVKAGLNSATPSYSSGVCSNTYCHGAKMPAGTTEGADTSPTWSNDAYITGNATNDCNQCHGYPPSAISQHSGKGPTDCKGCHDDVNPSGTGFDIVSQHIDGTLQVSGCSSCHGANNDGRLAGKHSVHYDTATEASSHLSSTNSSTATNYIFQCGNCHSDDSNHMGTVDYAVVSFNVAWAPVTGGTYNPNYNANDTTDADGKPISTDGSCSNLYCHSDGNGGAPNVAVSWDMAAGSLDCESCHNYDAAAANKMSSGSHTAHINDGTVIPNQGCEVCHNATTTDGTTIADKSVHVNGTKDVVLSGGGSYSGGNCSTNYCHSNGQGGAPLVDAQWGVTTADCVTCHDEARAGTTLSGAHESHVINAGATIGRDLSCDQCHADTVSNNTTISNPANHVDGVKTIKVAIDGTTCNNIQCHSDGNFDGTVTYNNPVWGTDTLDCTSCHGDGATKAYPAYADGNAGTGASNSHNAHVGTSGLNCEECHALTSVDGTAIDGSDPTQHVDQTVDISFKQGGTYNTGTETCSTTYCHGTGTPQWGGTVNCGDCHAVNNTLAGTHSTHWGTGTNASASDRSTAANNSTTGAYIFTCAVCHNGATHAGGPVGGGQTGEISFDAAVAGGGTYTAGGTTSTDPNGFDYTNGSCSSTYCHSDGAGGNPNVTPTWGATLDCASCHNYTAASGTPMASGSHTAHINDGSVMTNKSCEDCHNATTTDGTTIADKTMHVNQTKDVALSSTWGGSYTSGACSTSYCHSNGTALTSPYNAPNTDLVWGTGTADCTSCHDGPTSGPSYTNGSPKANSHAKHTGAPWSFGCVKCHDSTVDAANAITTPANHLNQTYDVSGADIGSYTYNTGGGTCSNIACHGGNNAQWGATLTCSDCHEGTGDVDDYTFNNGTMARIDSSEWTGSGHGQASISLTCDYCHDDTVSHGDGTNPFRLANNNANGNGWNDACFVCHMTGSTGYDPGAGNKNSTLKVDKYHYGTSHDATYNSGKFCWDCHDPHGDGNIKMVQAKPARRTDGTYGIPTVTPTTSVVFTNNTVGAGAGGFARTSAPYEEGICNTCHETAAGLNNYTSTSYDGSHYTSVCTQCHKHSPDTTVDGNAFQPSGGGCNGCHGYPPAIGDGKAYMDGGVGESKGAHTKHVNHLLSLTGYTLDPQNDSFGDAKWQAICGVCHNNATHEMSDSAPANRHIEVPTTYQFGPNAPVYNGVPGTSSTVNLKSCSNVSCHFKDSPGWQDPATAGN